MGKSPGLIITLIIFIILTLTLGVVTYFMAQGYKETFVKMEDADKKVRSAEAEIRALNDNVAILAKLIGYNVSPTDKNLDQFKQTCETELQKAKGDRTPAPKSYKDAIATLMVNLTEKNKEVVAAQLKAAEYLSTAQSQAAMSTEQRKTYDTQRKQADTSFIDQKNADNQKLKVLEDNLQKQIKDTDRIEQEAKNMNEKYRREAADAEEVAAAVAKINTDLSGKLDELSQVDFEVPDGTILFVDQKDRTLRVNIGKAEGVRILTSFGVYPSDALDVGRAKAKGAVEIVRVIGEHESEARIIEDEITNPVMPGDLIYTPLWKTGQEVLFALTYHLDVDKNGTSDLALLRNLIDSAGSRVVLWVDDEGQKFGNLTPDVTAIITADESILELIEKDSTKDQVTREQIKTTHMDLLQKARLNNVKEMKLSEFLRKVHYKQTSRVSRFQEPGGLGSDPMGDGFPSISPTSTAPIYTPGMREKSPTSDSPMAPIYDNSRQQKSTISDGKVSDYYFRKRTP